MPRLSFTVQTQLGADAACAYLGNLENARDWDPGMLSVVPESEGCWTVQYARWPSVKMSYFKKADAERRTVQFAVTSADGSVAADETYAVSEDETGTAIVYTIDLRLSGWRALPCVGAVAFYAVRADLADAAEHLQNVLSKHAVELQAQDTV